MHFLVKNTEIGHFGFEIQALLFFHEILQLAIFEGTDFKYDNINFKLEPQNTSIRLFCPKFRHFYFLVKFWKQTNQRMLLSNMTKVFKKFFPKNTKIRHFQLKRPKNDIFGPKFRDCCSFAKFFNQANSNVLI